MTRPQLDALRTAYAAVAPLDSLHTCACLTGRPVLIVHAQSDHAVPASTGDALWRGLGRPERWVYPGSHEALFLNLPWQLPAIMRWVDEHVRKDPGVSLTTPGVLLTGPGVSPTTPGASLSGRYAHE